MPSTSAESKPPNAPSFRALYYDGQSAKRRRVNVRLDETHLVIEDQHGAILDRWAYATLDVSDQGRGHVRLSQVGGDARLNIEHPRAFAAVKARAPKMQSHGRRAFKNVLLAGAATVVLVLGGYWALPVLSEGVVTLIPTDTDRRIGDRYADDFAAWLAPGDAGRCSNRAGRRALDDLVGTLAASQPKGSFEYRVDIIDTGKINAFALPGGQIFLLRGVLDKAQSADEVAGVLAHEMAHVTNRHGMQAMVRQYGLSMLGDLMFGGSMMGDVSGLAMMTSYSRQAELEADRVAIQTLTNAGISTTGLARFFKRLQAAETDSAIALPDVLSTHPPTDVRERLADQHAPRTALAPALAGPAWRALKRICEDRSD